MKSKGIIIVSILCLIFTGLFTGTGLAAADTAMKSSSGSASAIQAAANIVYAAGGGTVYIPEGTYNLDGSVTIRSNVKLVGAGQNKTVLRTYGTSQVINVLGNNARVSGFSLISTNYDGSIGININDSIDYRVDHIYIEGYSYAGIAVNGRDTRGVIDHSEIKMKIVTGLGYGVMVLRNNYWEDDMKLGTNQATFIEDCTIINARHAVASNQGAHYVFRNNHVIEGVIGQQVDAHGVGFGSTEGTRAIEVYNNLIENPISGTNSACGIRGGGGVIFNNTFRGYTYGVILMVESDQVGLPYPVKGQVHDMYVWNNRHDGSGAEVVVASSPYSKDLIKENRDYFRYAMPGYTPYPYPHPLTLGEDTNHAPVLNPIGDKSVQEGETLGFTVLGTDPDGDSLTFSASGLPSGSSFDPVTAVFSWTPSFTQEGAYSVVFRVSDGSLVDAETVTIMVNDTNHAPVLNPIGDKSVLEGETLGFTVLGTDPDGDSLTFSASGLPSGSSFDPVTAVFSWTPSFTQEGAYSVVFRVSDGSLVDTQTVGIMVMNAATSVSLPFRINAGGAAYTDIYGNYWLADQAWNGSWGFYGGDYTVDRGSIEIGGTGDDYIYQTERWNFQGYCFALPDGTYDVILHFAETFAAGEGRRIFDISAQGSTALDNLDIYAEVGMNFALVKVIQNVRVTDGILDISVTENVNLSEINGIEIMVPPENSAPVFNPIGDKSVREGETLTFVVSAYDPDNDTLAYSAIGLPAGSFFDSTTGVFSWTPSFTQGGAYEAAFLVSDGSLYDSMVVSIFVEQVTWTLRVNAGGAAYTDVSGNYWLADQAWNGSWGFYGGDHTVNRGSIEIGGTDDDYVYQTERWKFEGYRFALPDGIYDVVLHFAETFAPRAGRRLFDVSVQGVTVLDNLDIFAEVGMNYALVKVIENASVTNGILDISVTENVNLDEINGIEIISKS